MNQPPIMFHPVEFVIEAICKFLPNSIVDRGEGPMPPDVLRFRVFPNPFVMPYVHYSFNLPRKIMLYSEKEIIPLLEAPLRAAKEEFLSLEIGHVVETMKPEERSIEQSRVALTGSVPWVKI
jgi:hypothetical protein